ncbi:MAG: hypothetical protein ACKPKO_50495, partial [Candidatus Fonsibacter sp.]
SDLALEPPPPVRPERGGGGVPDIADIGAVADSVSQMTASTVNTLMFDPINVRYLFHDHLHHIVQYLHLMPGQLMTLGLCNDGDYPSITNDTVRHLRTVMNMNEQATDVVHEAKVPHYRWASMFIIYVNDTITSLVNGGEARLSMSQLD